MTRQPLTVVVPTRDRVGMLSDCLAALHAELAAEDRIVVADSASVAAGKVAELAEAHGAGLVRCDQPGTSRARNAGWRTATHELIGFIDDDVRVHAGWADAIVAAFDDPAVGFVTGRIVLPASQADAERPVAVSSRTERELLHPGLSGDLGASANLAVRRSALEAVGGFDETLGPGTWAASAEDLDLFDRLFDAGLSGLFEPAAEIEHNQWRTRGQLLSLDWRYGKGMGVRLARLARRDPTRSRRLLREAVVSEGIRPVLDDLRHGYEFGAATVATRTVGTMVGRIVGAMKLSDARSSQRRGTRS